MCAWTDVDEMVATKLNRLPKEARVHAEALLRAYSWELPAQSGEHTEAREKPASEPKTTRTDEVPTMLTEQAIINAQDGDTVGGAPQKTLDVVTLGTDNVGETEERTLFDALDDVTDANTGPATASPTSTMLETQCYGLPAWEPTEDEAAIWEMSTATVQPEAATTTEAATDKGECETATELLPFWRNAVQYFAGETCAAAVISSELIFSAAQPADEDGVHFTTTRDEAVQWCEQTYKETDQPFAVITIDDDEENIVGFFETYEKANAATRTRLNGRGTMGKNKLMFGFVGKVYVAAVPFAVYVSAPALQYSQSDATTLAKDCGKLAQANPTAVLYVLNHAETKKKGKNVVDIYGYV